MLYQIEYAVVSVQICFSRCFGSIPAVIASTLKPHGTYNLKHHSYVKDLRFSKDNELNGINELIGINAVHVLAFHQFHNLCRIAGLIITNSREGISYPCIIPINQKNVAQC